MELLARAAQAAAALAIGALAACYSPSLRDCTVTCGSPDDCATGQVCGSDGMCASPSVAGRCAQMATLDAGADAPAPVDAMLDAPAAVRLTVQITGKGKIDLAGIGTCSSLDPQKGNCAFDVANGVALTAQALPIQIDQLFSGWTTPTCSGQPSRCVFTPTMPTAITARFEHAGHSD